MLRRLFGRRPAPAHTGTDPTLQLLSGDWQCACCGQWFHGIMDLAADHPDPWPHEVDPEPNAALRLDGDFLSEDFCVLEGEHFMVRSVMEFPVDGLDRPWGFGCWTSLSKQNFEKYVADFYSGELRDEGPWFGWLCNRIKGLYTDGPAVPLDVWPQPGRKRPLLVALDEDNPVARAQLDGLSAEDLLRILRANGHGPMVH